MAQERLDEVVIDGPFNLNAAIESLRFYWNLARHKGAKVTMEIWAERGEVVEPRDAPSEREVTPVLRPDVCLLRKVSSA